MPNAPVSTLAAAASQPRWPARALLAVITVIAIALFVTAGNWQRERMQAKQALLAQYEAAVSAPPIPLPDLDARDDWASLRYRKVVATGEFEPQRQIFVDNRVHNGAVGYDVVAPLVLPDGRRVLVDRGWIAQGPTRSVLPGAPPPAGHVSVRGRINVPAGGYFELARASAQGALWQHLDPARYTEITGVAVLPAVIEQTVPAAPQDSLARDWTQPDFGIDKHRIYMVQWYTFAALALGLWIFFTLRGRRVATSGSVDG